jgi:hypothetical protein
VVKSVPQTSKSAVSQVSKLAQLEHCEAGRTANACRFGNRRYSRFGNLRYVILAFLCEADDRLRPKFLFGFNVRRVFICKEMSETSQLLAEYVDNGSETAFRELVSRYIGLVYSSALRMAGGDAHLAEDICQTVFIDLARNASKLSRDSALGGWLHRNACFVAGNKRSCL